jgi:hypothetical protein
MKNSGFGFGQFASEYLNGCRFCQVVTTPGNNSEVCSSPAIGTRDRQDVCKVHQFSDQPFSQDRHGRRVRLSASDDFVPYDLEQVNLDVRRPNGGGSQYERRAVA